MLEAAQRVSQKVNAGEGARQHSIVNGTAYLVEGRDGEYFYTSPEGLAKLNHQFKNIVCKYVRGKRVSKYA